MKPSRLQKDLLVVRSPGRWAVAPARRSELVEIDRETLVALMQTSRGASLDLLEQVQRELVLGGVLVDDAERPEDEAIATPHDRPRPRAADGESPLAMDALVAPVPGFVGRVVGGFVEVEGLDGRRLALDEVDLDLLSVFNEPIGLNPHEAAMTVRQILERVGGGIVEHRSAAELCLRLRRLTSAGRLLLAWEGSGAAERSWSRGMVHALRGSARRVYRGARHVVARVRAAKSGQADAPTAVVRHAVDVPGAAVTYLADPRPDGVADGLVPVYAMFQVELGPILSLGMLTAFARGYNDGLLARWYEIRRPEHPESMLADLATRTGPAVLLCSNYVWSIEHNLEMARRAKAIKPELVVIHGGPSTPKYEEDCRTFFAEHSDIVDIAVRGEGEVALAELLAALGPGLPAVDLERLRDVAGLAYRDQRDGTIVRTREPERVSDLDTLPSPYLTGEYDHLDPSAWTVCVTLETNRGCPYGCTFCDWGSATLSRVRNFDFERVAHEFEWAASRGLRDWVVADANFGIKARDVDIADILCDVKRRLGVPRFLGFNVAKNTTTHLVSIVDRLVAAGVAPECSLALQTRDENTLAVVGRRNISTDHYLRMAAAFRRRGLPIMADIMVGLPGQTVESFRADMEFLIEQDVQPRVWATQLLPNAPMNDPAYRAKHAVVADDRNMVISSASFTESDRREMRKMRLATIIFDQFGLLRHLIRHLMWDHGVSAGSFLQRLVDASEQSPLRYPLLNWTMRYFDVSSVPPLGWPSFYAEVRTFVAQEFSVEPSSALDAVLDVQKFLMPEYGRTFPATLVVDHDYLQYYRDATTELWRSGHAGRPSRPLAEYGPALFTVHGDPTNLCTGSMRPLPHARNDENHGQLWVGAQWELDSPLVRNVPTVVQNGTYRGLSELAPDDLGEFESEERPSASRVRVSIGTKPSVASSSAHDR